MAYETLRCPRCQYENIVLTCGFCIQCGNDLSHLIRDSASSDKTDEIDSSSDTTTLTSTSSDQTIATVSQQNKPNTLNDTTHLDASSPSLEQMITEAADLLGSSAIPSGNGWKLTLQIDGKDGTDAGRQQIVHVLRGAQESNLVSFLSLCGEVNPAKSTALLEWNGRLTGCAFAVRTIGGKRMFVLTANWKAHLLDLSLVTDTIRQIARRADQVESKLSDGADRF